MTNDSKRKMKIDGGKNNNDREEGEVGEPNGGGGTRSRQADNPSI